MSKIPPVSSAEAPRRPEEKISGIQRIARVANPEQAAIKGLVARQMNRSGNTLLCGLEPLSDEEFFSAGASGISAAWTVGHIACVNDLFSSWFCGEKIIDEETHRIFNNLAISLPTGTPKAASVDPARYSKQQLFFLLRQGQTKALRALDNFDASRWEEPPPPCAPDTLSNCGSVWEHLAVHTYWHLGELSGLLPRFYGTYTLNTLPHYFYYPRPLPGDCHARTLQCRGCRRLGGAERSSQGEGPDEQRARLGRRIFGHPVRRSDAA